LEKNYTIATEEYSIALSNSFNALQTFLQDYVEVKKFLIVDENTKKHCYPIIKDLLDENLTFLIEIKSGEIYKNLDSLTFIWQQLMQFNCTRNDIILNLGGGVIGDMGGFAASCFKRGLKFVHIPTTLLAMVDASVGGKLGINFEGLKNAIGSFNNPAFVYINPIFLNTLNKRQILSGFAEMLKHVLISDKAYWPAFAKIEGTAIDIESLKKSIEFKHRIVQKDWKEKGVRKLLNFGHTLGHALESYSLKKDVAPLLHGEAVAIGMFIETKLSELYFKNSGQEFESIYQVILSNYKPYAVHNLPFNEIKASMLQDKKNKNENELSFTLLEDIGSCKFDINCSDALIQEAINYYTNRTLIN